MIKGKGIVILILSLILLTACSSKPDNISQEVWDKGIQYTLYIDKMTKDSEVVSGSIGSEFNTMDLNDSEREITQTVLTLALKSLVYVVSKEGGTDTKEAKKDYDEEYKKLKDIFGSNLSNGKLDMDKVNEFITENESENETAKVEAKEDFMSKHTSVTLGSEVQYDFANNLDKRFYLEGEVKLCDYYNYGYTNEQEYFCGQVTPFDSDSTDTWYLYFHRDSFDGVYKLLLGGKLDLRIIAQIPSRTYQRGQGNMAVVKATEGFN